MRPAAVFCPQCGATTAPGNAHSVPAQGQIQGQSGMRAILWAVGALLLVAAAYLGWSYSTKNGLFAADGLRDFELLTRDEDEQLRVFLAYAATGTQPENILASARARCSEDASARPAVEVCGVGVAWLGDDRTRLAIGDPFDVDDWIGSEWARSDHLVALYLLDPNDDSEFLNPANDILLIDCAVFEEHVQSSEIVCKGSEAERDIIHYEHFAADAAAQADQAQMDAIAAAAAAVDAAAAAAPAYPDKPGEAAYDAAGYGTYHIVADANLRRRATASSSLIGRISRGTALQGTMMIGEDGESGWLMLADGSGYVSSVNTSQTPPPFLATILGDRQFRPSQDLRLYATPSQQSPVVDTVPAGTLLVITGITENGFAEAKGRSGGVGYFRASGYDFSR